MSGLRSPDIKLATAGSPPEVAAAYLFGREAALPALPVDLLHSSGPQDNRLKTLQFYFARHIGLDGSDHGPKATKLLASMCGDDEGKWRDANEAAQPRATSKPVDVYRRTNRKRVALTLRRRHR